VRPFIAEVVNAPFRIIRETARRSVRATSMKG
jgi:hypothetical protein